MKEVRDDGLDRMWVAVEAPDPIFMESSLGDYSPAPLFRSESDSGFWNSKEVILPFAGIIGGSILRSSFLVGISTIVEAAALIHLGIKRFKAKRNG